MLHNLIECRIALNSIPRHEIELADHDVLSEELLRIPGVSAVKFNIECSLVCKPTGDSNAEIIADLERIEMAANEILKYRSALNDEGIEIWNTMIFARNTPNTSGMSPCVQRRTELDGSTSIGMNFMPKGTKSGDRFHVDHGVGSGRNNDALVLWIGR